MIKIIWIAILITLYVITMRRLSDSIMYGRSTLKQRLFGLIALILWPITLVLILINKRQ